MVKFICETDQEKWAEYHLLDPKEFYNIVLPEELGINWSYLPRECLPNGEGVAYLKIDNNPIYAEIITCENIEKFFNSHKCHREEIRRNIKIICETEKEKWEQHHCLNPDKLRNFLHPCGPRGDWYYNLRVGNFDETFVFYFKVGKQLYAEIVDLEVFYPFNLSKWEWDETTQRMYACARYQLTNT
jgi:hypothetical protein